MRYYPRLRDIREDHDLTQTEIARMIACLKCNTAGMSPVYSKFHSIM